LFGSTSDAVKNSNDSRIGGVEIGFNAARRAEQIRVDWRTTNVKPTVATMPMPAPTAAAVGNALPVLTKQSGFLVGEPVDAIYDPLEFSPAGEVIDLRFAKLRMPLGITHAVVVNRLDSVGPVNSHDHISISYLNTFPPKAAFRADVGFSIKSTDDDSSVVETLPGATDTDAFQALVDNSFNGAFLVAGLIYDPAGLSGTPGTAAIAQWDGKNSPRFLRGYTGNTGSVPNILYDDKVLKQLLDETHSKAPGCPDSSRKKPTDTLLIVPDDFAALDFAKNGWHWSAKLNTAAIDYFSRGDSEAPLNQYLRIEVTSFEHIEDSMSGRVVLNLTLNIGSQFSATGTASLVLDLEDFSLSAETGEEITFTVLAKAKAVVGPDSEEKRLYSSPIPLFGLDAVFSVPAPQEGADIPDKFDVLRLNLASGRFSLTLLDDVIFRLRYSDIGEEPLDFIVDEFLLGPDGMDLSARIASRSLKLTGLDDPLTLDAASLKIENNRIRQLTLN